MAGEDLVELKFRLYDGTDIGPNKYAPATTVSTLKESILAQWPSGNTTNLSPSLMFCQDKLYRPVHHKKTWIMHVPVKPESIKPATHVYFHRYVSCRC